MAITGRHFLNRLDPQTPADPSRTNQHLSAIVRDVLAAPVSDGSVYVGSAGVAFMLCRLAQGRPTPSLSQHSQQSSEDDIMNDPERLLEASRRYLEAAEQTTSRHHRQSLLCGEAGLHCTAACVAAQIGESQRQQRLGGGGAWESAKQFVERYEALQQMALESQEDEFLYGKAGWIFGALLINATLGREAVPHASVLPVVEASLQSGHDLAARLRVSCPLFYTWHDKAYVGAAHGLMGICYVLLHVLEQGWDAELRPHQGGGSDLKSDLEGMLRFILSLELPDPVSGRPSGNFPNSADTTAHHHSRREPLVHWCHGAPGAVFLFAKASQVMSGDLSTECLQAAERAGDVVWSSGLLTKGPGLCHGVSGNGYALLALYRCTGDELHLQRAQQFGHFLSDPEFALSNTPDRPYSLYEGWAGAACFLQDLLRPSDARFPFFELP